MPLTYGSLCSGIAAEAVAWSPLSWSPCWFAEIDPFCSTLLGEKYGTPNLGDITAIEAEGLQRVDIVVGGTPCQAFSVNSDGRGMDDARGELSLSFMRIVAAIRPAWVIWENVPNVLRHNERGGFDSILRALEECGYGWAYRTFDLRRFGIAQRRRRLFLVGSDRGCGAAVAALFDGPAASEDSRAAGETRETGLARVDGWSGDETPKRGIDCVPTLRRNQGGEGVGVIDAYGLRNLSITEYERAQGFPAGYTAIKYRGKIASDSMRRKALGNSFPPPILRWIGERIERVQNAR